MKSAQPLVFAGPVAGGAIAQGRPAPQRSSLEQVIPSTNGIAVQAGRASRAHPAHPLPGMNGPINHAASAQPVAVTPEQVKRMIDVEALTDKVERQLMRRLSIEHERRGWPQ